MRTIRVLMIDSDTCTRGLVADLLSGEGWKVECVSHPRRALQRLREGRWHLVIAGASRKNLHSPLLALLEELALADHPVRVLFLVPALLEGSTRFYLERRRLPYVVKPLRLGEFLEEVSELLREAGVQHQPLTRVRELARESTHRQDTSLRFARVPHTKVNDTGALMFAPRTGCYDYDEEELRRFEEEEKEKKKKRKGLKPPEQPLWY